MERERGIQENNGAPMGQGQPGRRGGRRRFAEDEQQQAAPVPGVPQGMIPPMGNPAPPPMQYAQYGSPQQQPPQQQPDAMAPRMPQIDSGPGGIDLRNIIMGGQKEQKPLMGPRQLGGYSNVGNMLGFNTALDYDNESAKNSMKNVFGQIASRYKAAPSQLDAIMNDEDFKSFFPNARKVEGGVGDKIDFGGQIDPHSGAQVGVVDVGGAFDPTNDSGAGWTWQDLANAEQQYGNPMPGQQIYQSAQNQFGTPGGSMMMDQLNQMDQSTLMQLLQQLMAEDGGQGGGYY